MSTSCKMLNEQGMSQHFWSHFCMAFIALHAMTNDSHGYSCVCVGVGVSTTTTNNNNNNNNNTNNTNNNNNNDNNNLQQ